MQTIYRTPVTKNFTQFTNEFIATALPPVAKDILIYLLTKPENWKMQRNELKKTLKYSGYAIQKALKWLQLNGYAYFTRFCGRTTWFFTNTPHSIPHQPTSTEIAASPVKAESVENQHVENQHALKIIETDTNIKTTTTPTSNTVTENDVVVVSCENETLVYPEQLKPEYRKAAKHKIKKLKQPEIAQDVLFALAYAMSQGNIKSPIGYLNELVTRANDGTFTLIQTAAAKPDTRRIDATQDQLNAYRNIQKTEPGKASGFIAGLKAAVGRVAS